MHHCPFTDFFFSSTIHTLALREFYISGIIYTWPNKQAHATLEKLDKIIMSSEWVDLFPLVNSRNVV